jgi:transcriptional regulator with XRE-family HTH domain
MNRLRNQTALSDALDLTFQQVQKYENGGNRVSASRLSEIAAFLGVPVSFFFSNLPGGTVTPEERTSRERMEQSETIRVSPALLRAPRSGDAPEIPRDGESGRGRGEARLSYA